MTVTSISRTARDAARGEVTRAIVDTAREHLASDGAAGLSLRAVARDVGMASSAVYRYFPSRDDLLAALVGQAYDDLIGRADAAERRVRRRDLAGRWRAWCRGQRQWAYEHPHEYALLYGSPVAGSAAAQPAPDAAGRLPRALVELLQEAHALGRDPGDGPDAVPVPRAVHRYIAPIRASVGELSDDAVVRGLMAWTYLVGALTVELSGWRAEAVDGGDAFFDHEVDRLAVLLRLSDAPRRRR